MTDQELATVRDAMLEHPHAKTVVGRLLARAVEALLREVRDRTRDATARECIAECEEYTDPVLPSVIVADIRRRFNLSPTPEPRE